MIWKLDRLSDLFICSSVSENCQTFHVDISKRLKQHYHRATALVPRVMFGSGVQVGIFK